MLDKHYNEHKHKCLYICMNLTGILSLKHKTYLLSIYADTLIRRTNLLMIQKTRYTLSQFGGAVEGSACQNHLF